MVESAKLIGDTVFEEINGRPIMTSSHSPVKFIVLNHNGMLMESELYLRLIGPVEAPLLYDD